MFIDGSKLSMLFVFLLIVSLAIGYIIGYFTAPQPSKLYSYYKFTDDSLLADSQVPKRELIDEIDVARIRDTFKLLTKLPRLAGTEADKASAEYIAGFWKSEHLDNVQILDYDILLSYPDELKFNIIELKNETLSRRYEIKEKAYDDDLDYSNLVKPYLGFAKSGSVTSVSSDLYVREEARHIMTWRPY